MWTQADGARYLRNNLDVLRAYERSDKRMGPTLFAQRHWERVGQFEGRKSGAELDPKLKREELPDDYFTPEAIERRLIEEERKADEIRAKPVNERTLYDRDWLRQYELKRDPLRGVQLVPESQIAAAFARENPHIREAWKALPWLQQLRWGWFMPFALANKDLKEGEEPLPKLTADELQTLRVKYTLEM